MSRFAPQMVCFGLVTIWSFATPPTIKSFLAFTATTEGRIRFPRSVGTTLGILLRTEATQMLVVPRSMPMMRVLSAIGSGRVLACTLQGCGREKSYGARALRGTTCHLALAAYGRSGAVTSRRG